MDLPFLIEALSRPSAYPHPVTDIQSRQTHISVVFLAGPYAYKIKKPVQLSFVDFSTLERRRHFCQEEVRLNRRLAPTVYLAVLPVTRKGNEVRIGGDGEVVEWTVQMERLPEEATLQSRLAGGDVSQGDIRALARRIAGFHTGLAAGGATGDGGTFAVVAGNVRDNLALSETARNLTVSRAVHDRLLRLTEAELARLRALIESRARRGVPRDTHGDLHLDHIYLFPDRPAPADLVIVDCIEFNDRFRFTDPVADMAFVVMDLLFHGRRYLARSFAEEYFRATGDREGQALLPFYAAYRATVRAKVEGLKLDEPEVPSSEREAARVRACAHWLLALGLLAEPTRRPCLVLVAGLPGAGKSTLARALADRAGVNVIRSDVVRKELAAANGGAPLYSPDLSRQTYDECLRRAAEGLWEGRRVLVDANFRREEQRRPFVELAARWAVPLVILVCRAAPEVVRRRLAGREGDASDADWTVYQQLAGEWEEPGEATRRSWREISTTGSRDEAQAAALAALREQGLLP
jgi:aminoglycoside phosphotransferase family enzyme/predicted kinase